MTEQKDHKFDQSYESNFALDSMQQRDFYQLEDREVVKDFQRRNIALMGVENYLEVEREGKVIRE
jgi:hypothetical protein